MGGKANKGCITDLVTTASTWCLTALGPSGGLPRLSEPSSVQQQRDDDSAGSCPTRV